MPLPLKRITLEAAHSQVRTRDWEMKIDHRILQVSNLKMPGKLFLLPFRALPFCVQQG